jgi:hypothetical protein
MIPNFLIPQWNDKTANRSVSMHMAFQQAVRRGKVIHNVSKIWFNLDSDSKALLSPTNLCPQGGQFWTGLIVSQGMATHIVASLLFESSWNVLFFLLIPKSTNFESLCDGNFPCYYTKHSDAKFVNFRINSNYQYTEVSFKW